MYQIFHAIWATICTIVVVTVGWDWIVEAAKVSVQSGKKKTKIAGGIIIIFLTLFVIFVSLCFWYF